VSRCSRSLNSAAGACVQVMGTNCPRVSAPSTDGASVHDTDCNSEAFALNGKLDLLSLTNYRLSSPKPLRCPLGSCS